MRDFQLPGRSPVRTTGVMAATSHPHSMQAALDILRAGGIGGDCCVLYCPDGKHGIASGY